MKKGSLLAHLPSFSGSFNSLYNFVFQISPLKKDLGTRAFVRAILGLNIVIWKGKCEPCTHLTRMLRPIIYYYYYY